MERAVVTDSLAGVRVGLLERRHPPGHRGALVDTLVPELRSRGALVDVVHAEEGWHRLDERPRWDVVVLKSGSAAALHLAAAAEAWGVPSVNGSHATRLAQDKLASSLMLQDAGLPIAPSHIVWLDGPAGQGSVPSGLEALSGEKLLVKAARGSQGVGLWTAEAGELPSLLPSLSPGPYLVMGWVPHEGDDLKVFVAGTWMGAIERPYPAKTLEEKLGRPVAVPPGVSEIVRAAGDTLGLVCYGCDLVVGPAGWTIVDVNAFPGYKGVDAAAAISAVIAAAAAGRDS